MMFKKILILTFPTLAVAGVAYANTPFQGFYADLGVGGINTNFNLSQVVSIAPYDNSFTANAPYDPNNSDYGVTGSLGLGYTFLLTPSVTLGAEINADVEDATTTNNDSVNFNIPGTDGGGINASNTITNKLKNSFAFLIKPGFLMDQGNTMVYGIIGPRWGNFETSTSSLFQINNGDGNGNAGGSAANSHSGYDVGLVLGAGIQKYISNNLSVGVEYQYTNYGHISTPSSSGVIYSSGVGGGTLSNTINSIKAQTNVLAVHLMYHF